MKGKKVSFIKWPLKGQKGEIVDLSENEEYGTMCKVRIIDGVMEDEVLEVNQDFFR